MDAWIGLAGAAIGALITIGTNWVSRRWERQDRSHEILIARAEELAGSAVELGEWAVRSSRAAFEGDNEPLPANIHRMQLLVSVYVPEVEASGREVLKGIDEVQQACAKLADHVRRGQDVQAPAESVRAAMTSLTSACVDLTDAIGKQIRVAQKS